MGGGGITGARHRLQPGLIQARGSALRAVGPFW